MSVLRFRVKETSDLKQNGKIDKKKIYYRRKSEKQTKKHVETLVRLLGRATAAGLKPLRFPAPKPVGTGVGVSARIYDSNSLGDRAKEGRGRERRHAGTREGISARIHVANSHGDRAKEGRRSDHRHSTNSFWEVVASVLRDVGGWRCRLCVARQRSGELNHRL